MIAHVVEKDGPVELPYTGINAVLFQLVLERQGNAFANIVPRVNLISKRNGVFLPLNALVQNAVAVGISPARFPEQLQGLLGIIRMAEERLIVFWAKQVHRPIYHLAEIEEDGLDHLLPVCQIGHSLAHTPCR